MTWVLAQSSEDLPGIDVQSVVFKLLDWIGVPFAPLVVLNFVLAALGWRVAALHAARSVGLAVGFFENLRVGVAWRLVVAAACQALFFAGAYSASRLVPAIDAFGADWKQMPQGWWDLLELAFTYEATGSAMTRNASLFAVGLIVLVLAATVTGLPVLFVPAGVVSAAFAVLMVGCGLMAALIGLLSLSSYFQDSDGVVESQVHAQFLLAGLMILCGVSAVGSVAVSVWSIDGFDTV